MQTKPMGVMTILLAILLVSPFAGVAQAGTAASPNITDPVGDASVPFDSVDIVSAWISPSVDQIDFHIRLADLEIPVTPPGDDRGFHQTTYTFEFDAPTSSFSGSCSGATRGMALATVTWGTTLLISGLAGCIIDGSIIASSASASVLTASDEIVITVDRASNSLLDLPSGITLSNPLAITESTGFAWGTARGYPLHLVYDTAGPGSSQAI